MVLADANVVLELLIPGRRYRQEVAATLGRLDQVFVTTLTTHLVWYFSRKERIHDAVIAEQLAAYTLLPLTAADYAWARANEQGKDFEDALQVAVAVNNRCESFITLDKALARRYASQPLEFIIPALNNSVG